jgi:hypothetical protein
MDKTAQDMLPDKVSALVLVLLTRNSSAQSVGAVFDKAHTEDGFIRRMRYGLANIDGCQQRVLFAYVLQRRLLFALFAQALAVMPQINSALKSVGDYFYALALQPNIQRFKCCLIIPRSHAIVKAPSNKKTDQSENPCN